MPLFRRKTDSKLPQTSSISVYGQGKAQAFRSGKNSERSSDSGSYSSIDLEDRPHPLAFAEATFDPCLPMKTKSRLSKDLQEVLHDNAALAYFIQFLDAHKAKHLVKFWLEAESFRFSLETKCKSQNFITTSNDNSDCTFVKSENVFHDSSQSIGHTLEAFSSTCDQDNVNMKTACVPVDNYKDVPSLNSGSCHLKLTNIGQSLSGDSGCEDKLVSNCVHKEAFRSGESSVSENNFLVTKEHCDKSSNDSLELDLGIEVTSNKECKSDLLKYSIVRLETSIEQDAYSIYSKYISCDAPLPIGINEELRISIENNLKKSPNSVISQCFVPAQEFVVKKMDNEYFPNFLRSNFHCKHQIDVLTSGSVYLADVLYNDSALFFFMEFMEQEGVRHLVDFLLMANNFQKHLLSQGKYDGMQAQTDAMVVYEKYFSLQATTPLGFSDQVRYEVEANICREEGPLPDCFLKPVKILTQYLEKTYLLQFLNSQLYFKYISECIIIIQTGGADAELQQKYTGSDSGSEQSLPISSINTLLAMDSKQLGASKIIKNLGDQDMRIDVMQFKPDALWKRPQAGKLQMAHVDHLGRVTVDFEPEPEKRRESRISKAVKKLVNWDEDKVKNVRLPRENGDKGRIRGFGYAEFFNRQDLIQALALNNETLKNRAIKVTLAGEHDGDRDRRDGGIDRTSGDWRADKKDPFSRDESSRNDGDRDRRDGVDRTSGDWRADKRNQFSRDEPSRNDSYSSRGGYSDREPYRARSNYDKDRFDRNGGDRNDFSFRNDRDFGRDQDRRSNDRGYGFSDRGMSRGGGRRDFREGFNRREEPSRDSRYRESERDFPSRDNYDRRPPDRPSYDSGPKERPKLQLAPRTKPIEPVPPPSEAVSSNSIFGGAKPVDTAAREREIEERLAKEKESVSKDPRERSDDRVRKFSTGSGMSNRSRRSSDSGPPGSFRDDDDQIPPYKPPISRQHDRETPQFNTLPRTRQRNSSNSSGGSDRENQMNSKANHPTSNRKENVNSNYYPRSDTSDDATSRPSNEDSYSESRSSGFKSTRHNHSHRDNSRERALHATTYEEPKPPVYTSANKFSHLMTDADDFDRGSNSE